MQTSAGAENLRLGETDIYHPEPTDIKGELPEVNDESFFKRKDEFSIRGSIKFMNVPYQNSSSSKHRR